MANERDRLFLEASSKFGHRILFLGGVVAWGLNMDTIMKGTSVARVYADVNLKQPKGYYDYESLQVEWG